MKTCSYCGRENEEAAPSCVECATELPPGELVDAKLTDPSEVLKVVAIFADLFHATLLKDQLAAAGINACIPEELASSPFGTVPALARITVQVATRDYDAAREIFAASNLPQPPPPPMPPPLPNSMG
jgi:hypothetical protein